MRCGHCAYWVRDTDEDEEKEEWGECVNSIYVYQQSCVIPKDALVLYSDYEGYFARIKMHENFGCVGFKLEEVKS